MKQLAISAVLLALFLPIAPVHAAWTDTSYNPNPDPIDESEAVEFDSFGILAHMVNSTGGRTKHTQNFENGFTAGQRIDDWVRLGDTRVRFGAGSSLQSILWQADIGSIDPYASDFGLTHPHGTYGNAPGVLGQPRNYVADLHFLSFASSTAPTYIVMQFEQPVSWLGFSMIDYAAGTGGNANVSLWNGNSLDSLTALPLSNGRNGELIVGQDEIAGNSWHLGFNGALDPRAVDNRFPSFNFAILRLDAQDSGVGLDNFIVSISPVPEANACSMMVGGLMLLGLALRRRTRHTLRER